MKIVSAKWTPAVNLILLVCQCKPKEVFTQRADRWIVVCPSCGCRANLGKLREDYFILNHKGD